MKDSLEIITCPACGTEMKKIYIEEANCHVDICVDGCGGIFFDNQEFKKFDEQHENIDKILEAYKKNKTYFKKGEFKKRTCPSCNAIMNRHFASSLHEIEIDECYCCGSIFLDYGELEAIRKQFKTEEERSKAFQKYFNLEHDISNFKDYKPKTSEELFGKNENIKRVFSNKHINLINKLIEKLK